MTGMLPLFDGTCELGFEPATAVRRLVRADAKLAAVIETVGPCRLKLKTAHSSFAALAEAIIYQQLTGKAAATILGRFKALYPGRKFPSTDHVLATADSVLRQAGISAAKAAALKDLSRKVQDGTVPPVAKLRRLSDEEIIERLIKVRGIGPWTVQMLLIFRLGRPDVLATDDYGLRKGCARTYGLRALPTPRQLGARGESWKPYRSVASWYLWRAAEL